MLGRFYMAPKTTATTAAATPTKDCVLKVDAAPVAWAGAPVAVPLAPAPPAPPALAPAPEVGEVGVLPAPPEPEPEPEPPVEPPEPAP